jgi:regulator of sigma E protease
VDSTVTNVEPATIGDWLKKHATSLVTIAVVLGLVFWRLHPEDVFIAAFGLSFIIFIHELGHFLAAKACDVHVKTFSIGFGPALPFCSYKFGETTYKLALIPLGGFVSMVGQEDGVVDESEDPDPRSYRNKSVPQRMLIISAGVIMNVLLAAVCFIAAYRHGVQEKPAVIATIEPGSAAWRAGLYSGTRIQSVGSWAQPVFDDIRPLAMSAQKGEQLAVTVEYAGKSDALMIEPLREDGQPFPVFGIAPPRSLELPFARREKITPFVAGSPAALAKSADGQDGFLAGDTIVGMTDPADPNRSVTAVTPAPGEPPYPYFEYLRRLAKLATEPITFHVLRKGSDGASPPVTIVVPPAVRHSLGMRMRMGPVTAVRANSPASAAGVVEKIESAPGDRIVSVEVTGADGKAILYSNEEAARADTTKTVRPLDPLRLPFELSKWAESNPPNPLVHVAVLREKDHKDQRIELPPMTWDDSHRYDQSNPISDHSPIAVSGLGLAYHVLAVVDAVTPGGPADLAGIKPNDSISEITFPSGNPKQEKSQPIKPHYWASVETVFQRLAPASADPALHTLAVKIKRGSETIDARIVGAPDPSWPLEDRGLFLADAKELQQAETIGQALAMGFKRTMRTIRGTYLNLYGMVTGRTSITMISGPITLARVSYIFAGQDTWLLIVLLGVISINLAVVNFLPIPVLDGGHMVFLLYEWIRGKPAPERVQEYLVYAGLACVGCLMLLSIGMDVWRLFT